MLLKKILIAVFSVLMFLPCVFIGTNALYYGFNHEATAQTHIVETPVYYETNEVNSWSDLQVGKVYTFVGGYSSTFVSGSDTIGVYIEETLGFGIPTDYWVQAYSGFNTDFISLMENGKTALCKSGRTVEKYTKASTVTAFYGGLSSLDFEEIDFVYSGLVHSPSSGFVSNVIKKCPRQYETGVTETHTYTMSIIDSMNYSVERTFELPIFNWATDNDTHAVLETVGSYMDMDSDNAVLSLLNYWLCVGGLFLVVYAVCLLPMYTLGFMDR